MSGSDDTKRSWIAKMLRVELPKAGPSLSGRAGGAPDPAQAFVAAREGGESACDTVDTNITGLQGVLAKSEDDDLEAIAKFGLNGITGGYKVKLMAALRDLGSGTPEAMQKGGAKALAAVQDFHSFINTDERVLVCDENPWKAPVAIRATLGRRWPRWKRR